MWVSTNLHDTRGGYFVVVISAVPVIVLAVLVDSVAAPLPLDPRIFCDALAASLTLRDNSLLDLIEYLITLDLVLTFDTRSRGERSVALHDVLWEDTGIRLDIVDILSVVGQ